MYTWKISRESIAICQRSLWLTQKKQRSAPMPKMRWLFLPGMAIWQTAVSMTWLCSWRPLKVHIVPMSEPFWVHTPKKTIHYPHSGKDSLGYKSKKGLHRKFSLDPIKFNLLQGISSDVENCKYIWFILFSTFMKFCYHNSIFAEQFLLLELFSYKYSVVFCLVRDLGFKSLYGFWRNSHAIADGFVISLGMHTIANLDGFSISVFLRKLKCYRSCKCDFSPDLFVDPFCWPIFECATLEFRRIHIKLFKNI